MTRWGVNHFSVGISLTPFPLTHQWVTPAVDLPLIFPHLLLELYYQAEQLIHLFTPHTGGIPAILPGRQQAQAFLADEDLNSHISGQFLHLGCHSFLGISPLSGGNMFRPAVSETVRRRAGFLSKEGQHLVPHHLTHFPHPQLQHCMDGTDYAHSLTHSQWVVTVVSHLLCSPRLFKAYHQVPRAGDDTFVGCLNSAANVPAPSLLT